MDVNWFLDIRGGKVMGLNNFKVFSDYKDHVKEEEKNYV